MTMSTAVTNEALVERYGEDILKVRKRPQIPPRRAKDRHRLAVVPKIGARQKLVAEVKQSGHKATVGRHRVTKEEAANVVWASALPGWSKHAQSVIGEASFSEIRNLFGSRPPPDPKARPFNVDDRVKTHVGWVGTVIEDRGRVFRVKEDSTGRILTVHELSMIRIG